MSINFTTYTAQITNLMVVASSDPNFQTMQPGMIDYAEQRMYRELDLLATRVTDSSGSLTAASNTFSLPTDVGTYLVVEEVNIITPASAGTVALGTRNPLVNTSVDFIDLCYPTQVLSTSQTNPQVPEFFAVQDNGTLLLGPTPDSSYIVEVRGTQRPTPLSSANSSTILTAMLPDAFVAASMVYAAGYMRDFGSQSDNPQMAQSWENQYNTLIQSANVEELRKKYQSQAWTSQIPTPIATPPRV
jgi:hypothetical protein